MADSPHSNLGENVHRRYSACSRYSRKAAYGDSVIDRETKKRTLFPIGIIGEYVRFFDVHFCENPLDIP